MREMLTTDTYKMIYKDITPSDEFRQRMLNQGVKTKVYRMKPRLSYVAAIVACMVLMVSGMALRSSMSLREKQGESIGVLLIWHIDFARYGIVISVFSIKPPLVVQGNMESQ